MFGGLGNILIFSHMLNLFFFFTPFQLFLSRSQQICSSEKDDSRKQRELDSKDAHGPIYCAIGQLWGASIEQGLSVLTK